MKNNPLFIVLLLTLTASVCLALDSLWGYAVTIGVGWFVFLQQGLFKTK